MGGIGTGAGGGTGVDATATGTGTGTDNASLGTTCSMLPTCKHTSMIH